MKKLSSDTNQQRKRLYEALLLGAVTTLYARIVLDVFHPAGRIQELRARGENIITIRRTVNTRKGRHSQVAEYVLLPRAA